jgi:hypothetical protein
MIMPFVLIVAAMVMALVLIMVAVVMGFGHVLLRLFVESHFAAGSAEVVGRAIVFALPTGRVVGVHIHLANWVNRCRHSRLLRYPLV